MTYKLLNDRSILSPVAFADVDLCITDLLQIYEKIYTSHCKSQTYQPEVESRTQGSRPRPRTQKKSEAKAKDSLSEDRPSRGQGQECSRPRPRTKDTAASVLEKKRSSKKFSRQSPIYRRSQNFWLGRPKPQITCNDVIKNLPAFHLTRILQRERASTNIVEKCKYVTLETF